MYSTLMVHLDLDRDNAPLLDITSELAERFDADVVGIMACQPVALIVGDSFVPVEVFESDRTEIEEQMKAAEQAFRTALAKRAGRLHWRAQLTNTAPTAYIVQQVRSADLLITGVDTRSSWDNPARRVDVEDLVMQAGRPALIVPAGARKLAAENILVGWKDTRVSRRAVTDALPFLQTAKRVVVAEVVGETGEIPDARKNAEDVCAWLQRHDVAAEPLAISVGSKYVVSLDSIAEQVGADLVVAGAYGHSRMREWALGGVTRDLLKHSRRCSLLSH
ncbi:MAG: universal stress protein [Rhodanobacter sp.]